MITQHTHNEDDLLTVIEAGEVLHASRVTVFRIIKTGELASIKVGKKRLIRRGAITDFVHRQEQASRRRSA